MRQLLETIVKDDKLHAKWLNTLSYLENCGARKIAACEHSTLVKEEMLKHASEEFRHSHYLKKQIKKLSPTPFPNYCLPLMLGGIPTLHYLNALDLHTAKFLTKEIKITKLEIKKIAYLLVTYAIELRAEKLYPLYHEVLKNHQSNVFVKSIILEEEEHLQEMKEGISNLPSGFDLANRVCSFEQTLFDKWIKGIELELNC